MAKVHTVTLGGNTFPLAYTVKDAIALKRRFGKPLTILLRQDVMGMQERPKLQAECGPDEVLQPGETIWEAKGLHDVEIQVAFLHVGIVAGGAKKVTEAQVLEWVDAHMKAEQNMGPLVGPVWKAVLVSGITGTSVDVDEVLEEAAQPTGKG